MKAITPPLRIGNQGSEVANLQTGLLILLRRQFIRLPDSDRVLLEDGLVREQKQQIYQDTTAKTVSLFQSQSQLSATGDVDGITAERLNQILQELGAIETTPSDDVFVVTGTILQANHTPLARITVQAFDKDLRSLQLLGQTTTDAFGKYRISYTRDQFIRAEKQTADLIIVALEPIPATVPQFRTLATSPTLFNAPSEVVIDLVIGADVIPIPSEYEQLMAEIQPLLGDQQIADLREDTEENLQTGKFRDISFLSGETGINPELINFLVIAAKFGTRTDLHPAVFYGFFQQKLPTDLPALITQSQEIQRHALEVALHDNIIPIGLKDELEQILKRLQTLHIQQPEFLVKPEVLFGNLTDLSHLTEEESDFITAKLNDRLRREILNLASSASEAITNALQTAVTRINYQQFKDADVTTVLKETVLLEIKKNKALAEEAIQIESRLAENPSPKISELLYLDVPLKENPLFDAEVRRGKTFAYTKLAGLNDEVARNLAAKNLSLDDLNDIVLADLVKEGILNDQQKTTLQLTTDLGKLTGDNLPLSVGSKPVVCNPLPILLVGSKLTGSN